MKASLLTALIISNIMMAYECMLLSRCTLRIPAGVIRSYSSYRRSGSSSISLSQRRVCPLTYQLRRRTSLAAAASPSTATTTTATTTTTTTATTAFSASTVAEIFTYDQLPEETLYILDGTAMLFLAHFSREQASQHSDAVLTSDMSRRLVRNLDAAQQQQLRDFYADQISSPSAATNALTTNDNIVNQQQQQQQEQQLMDALSCGALTTLAMNFARFIRDVKPRYLAAAFDAGRKTFRSEEFPDYKATRTQPPLELLPLFPLVPHVLEALGCRCLMQVGFEADDLMASLGTWAKQRGLNVVHVSPDKDMMQLVDYGVHVMVPRNREMFGQDEVRSKYGIAPAQFCDFQALHGDASDNIPGVKGIGPVTAAALLRHFNSVEEMFRATALNTLPALPSQFAQLSPTDKQLQLHLRELINKQQQQQEQLKQQPKQHQQQQQVSSAATAAAVSYEEAVSQLRLALIGVNAKAETVLARLYQCGIAQLLLYTRLVTLITDLPIEQMLTDSPATTTTPVAATAAIEAKWSLNTDYFRYRGENAKALLPPANAAMFSEFSSFDDSHIDDNSSNSNSNSNRSISSSSSSSSSIIRSSSTLESQLAAISPSLLPALQLLREQYHKLDRA